MACPHSFFTRRQQKIRAGENAGFKAPENGKFSVAQPPVIKP